jgi:anti-anti-sigma factor
MKRNKREPGDFVAVLESTDREEVVHVYCDIDLANVHEFEAFIGRAFVLGKRTVIDLTECSYLDSAFLRSIFATHEMLGPRLQLRVTRDSAPERVVRVAGIDGLMSVVVRPAPPRRSAPLGLVVVESA